MKKINIIRYCTVLLVASVLMTSCYKESNWLDDNITSDGNHFPVIAGITVLDEVEFYKEGNSVKLDLDYWSLDEIDKVILYENIGAGDPKEVGSFPFVSNFQEDSQTDELLIDYTVPSLPSDTIQITLDVEVVNKNGLTRNSRDSGTGNRPSVTINAVK